MDNIQIYSGTCCFCDIGIPTREVDIFDRPIFTGDIVQNWHGQYIGSDLEQWLPISGLTAIVCNQYQSYSDGTVKLLDDCGDFFVMGIRDSGFNSKEWKVCIIKSHEFVINGEKWEDFGFNYKNKTQSVSRALEESE